jgi:hypothetical protein
MRAADASLRLLLGHDPMAPVSSVGGEEATDVDVSFVTEDMGGDSVDPFAGDPFLES